MDSKVKRDLIGVAGDIFIIQVCYFIYGPMLEIGSKWMEDVGEEGWGIAFISFIVSLAYVKLRGKSSKFDTLIAIHPLTVFLTAYAVRGISLLEAFELLAVSSVICYAKIKAASKYSQVYKDKAS